MRNVLAARAWLVGSLALVAIGLGCGDSPTAPTQPPPPAGPQPLKVSFVSPNTGPAGVVTAVRIGGTGFETGATLMLDDVATPATFVNSTTLTAQAPSHAAGPIDVVVINPGGQSSRLEHGFTYTLVLASLTLSGNSVMNAIGETSQLTATAGFTDGTTEDVTRQALWTSADPNIVTVTPDGVLTARANGRTAVVAKYPAAAPPALSRFRSVNAVVTPFGTFSAAGRVREPGASSGDHGTGSIAGALVRQVASGESILTDLSGIYTLVALTDGRLAFSKTDFEPVEIDSTRDGFDDVPMQRVIRIGVGSAETRTLAPHDMAYEVAPGTRCEPCKMIRIASSEGSVRIRLTWTSTTLDLHVWVNGQMHSSSPASRVVELDMPIVGGESIAYVGVTSGPGSFTGHQLFTVTVTPGG